MRSDPPANDELRVAEKPRPDEGAMNCFFNKLFEACNQSEDLIG
jgi:hypothetical protein